MSSACSTSSNRACREQPWIHDADALTDRNERFLAGEIVREKLFRLTGDELPYTSTVVIDRFEEETAGAALAQAAAWRAARAAARAHCRHHRRRA